MSTEIDPAGNPANMSRIWNAPIVECARHLESLYRQWENATWRDRTSLSAAISETEGRILAQPATTAVEAAVQIMLVFSLVEQLRVDDGTIKELLLARLEALTASALGGLTRALDFDLSELGRARYVPDPIDPLAS